MLVNGVSLFDNRFKNYKVTNLSKENTFFKENYSTNYKKTGLNEVKISFRGNWLKKSLGEGVTKEAEESSSAIEKAAEEMFPDYKNLKEKGLIKKGDDEGGRLPGTPESD